MRILAIDPGFERMGIAIIDKTIKPKHELVYLGRLNEDKGLLIVTEIAKSRPDLIVTICGQGMRELLSVDKVGD